MLKYAIAQHTEPSVSCPASDLQRSCLNECVLSVAGTDSLCFACQAQATDVFAQLLDLSACLLSAFIMLGSNEQQMHYADSTMHTL